MDIKELKDQVKGSLESIKDFNTRYILDGFMEITNEYGDIEFIPLVIYMNEEDFKEIQKDPLRDYADFGVPSVNYVYFKVTKEIIMTTDNLEIVLTEDLKPIEAGEKQGDYDFTAPFLEDPYEIYY